MTTKRLTQVKALWHFFLSRVRDTHLQEVASSMTLTTLLSIVPVLAVSLAVFALFPSFAEQRQTLEEVIFNSFLPAQYSTQIVGYLKKFSEHASGLGAVGVIFLTITALMLIDKFFVTVNRIFKVTRLRSWQQRALLYWALITVGPALVASSLTLSTQAVTDAMSGLGTGSRAEILELVQVLMQALAFTLLFKLVPNAHVPTKHAALGGTFVALAFLLTRSLFELYVTKGTLGNIYGAFVALPVLLLWIYLTWFIIFAGAAVTATVPLLTSGRFSDHYRAGDPFLTGVALLKVLTRARQTAEPLVSLPVLCNAVDTFPQGATAVLETLAEAGYCAPVITSKEKHPTWTLTCDPDETTLARAVDVLLLDHDNALLSPNEDREGCLGAWYEEWRRSRAITQTLTELFGE